MLAHPLGQGLGSAGPASYRTGFPIIPESWYLQVGIEFGFIGLLLFLSSMVYMAKKLLTGQSISSQGIQDNECAMQRLAALAGFLGVLTIAFFLHTLEDSAVSLTLFGLLGLLLGTVHIKPNG